MNDDLISRSALKENFKSRLALCNEWIEKAKDKETRIRADATKIFICEVIMTIDNAPTVVAENATSERPTGEWIKTTGFGEIRGDILECPVCHEQTLSSHKNFCPSCGAECEEEENND